MKQFIKVQSTSWDPDNRDIYLDPDSIDYFRFLRDGEDKGAMQVCVKGSGFCLTMESTQILSELLIKRNAD